MNGSSYERVVVVWFSRHVHSTNDEWLSLDDSINSVTVDDSVRLKMLEISIRNRTMIPLKTT